MINIFHIAKGWFSSLIYATDQQKKLSAERMAVCETCPFAVETTFTKILPNEALEEKKKACKFCGCPIYEKSLVKEEKCPMNLWKR